MVTYEAADPFRAAADPTRREILELVAGRGRAVAQIAERFPMSRPAISKHLRILLRAGLVREEKEGRSRIYRAEPEALKSIAHWAGRQAERATAGHGGGQVDRATGGRPRRESARGPASVPEIEAQEDDWRSW